MFVFLSYPILYLHQSKDFKYSQTCLKRTVEGFKKGPHWIGGNRESITVNDQTEISRASCGSVRVLLTSLVFLMLITLSKVIFFFVRITESRVAMRTFPQSIST